MSKGSRKRKAPAATVEKTVFRGFRLYPLETELARDHAKRLSKVEEKEVSESEVVRRAIRSFCV